MVKNKDYYLSWLNKRGNAAGDRKNLDVMEILMNELGNPQDKIKIIHIAGTNGKGSTANYISSTLSLKLKCGLFTSPYMEKINEEIQINGKAISDEDFIFYIEKIKSICEKLDSKGYVNSYFDIMTAIMYKYFYDKKVDVAVVEVGLGGLLDSTNVVKNPLACVIATISMDHTNVLGNSLKEIAENKAGIIKENVAVFVYPQKYEAYKIIEEKSLEKNSKIISFDFDDIDIIKENLEYNEFSYKNYRNIKTSLIGRHQIYNAINAINLLDYFKEKFDISNEDIKKGIFFSKNPGRLEMISRNPRVLVDGSHNKESIDYLINSLKLFEYDKLIVGFSVLKDKDYYYIIDKLSEIASEIIITKIDNPRAFLLEELEDKVKEKNENIKSFENMIEAYNYSKKVANKKDLVLWCGSLYLVGEILKYENNKNI